MGYLQLFNTVLIGALSYLIAGKLFQQFVDRLLATIILGAGGIVAIVLINGYVVRNLSPIAHLITGVLLFVPVYILLCRRMKPAKSQSESDFPVFGFLEKTLIVFLAFLSFYHLFCIVLFPEFGWDSIVYHVSNLPYWHQNNNLLPYPTAAAYAMFSPLNFALLNFWFFQILGMDLIIELPSLFFALIAFFAVYGIAREMHVSKQSSLWAAALFFTMPIIVLAAKYCHVDMPMASAFLAAIYFGLRFHKCKQGAFLYLLGMCFGLVVGMKFLGLYLVAPLVGVSLYWNFREYRKYLGHFPLVLLIVLITGGGWYVKNWIVYHNPLYPQRIAVGNHELFPGRSVENVETGKDSLLKNLRGLKRIRDGRPLNKDAYDMSGWGGQIFTMVIPVTFFCGWIFFRARGVFKEKMIGLFVVFAIPLLLLLLTLKPYPWWFKYCMWFPGVIVLGIGGLMDRMQSRSLKFALLGMIVISMITSSGYGEAHVDKERFKQFLRLPWSRNATAVYGNHLPSANPYLYLYNLRGIKTIGYYCEREDCFVYPLFDNRYERKVVYYNKGIISDVELAKFICEKSIEYFYSDSPKMLSVLRKLPNVKEIYPNVFQSI